MNAIRYYPPIRVAQRYLLKIFSVLLVTGCVAPIPNNQSSGSVYAPAQRVYTPVQRVYTPPVQRVYTPAQRIYTPAPAPVVVQPNRTYERNTTIYRNTYNYGKPTVTPPPHSYGNQPYDYRKPTVMPPPHSYGNQPYDYRNAQQHDAHHHHNEQGNKYQYDNSRYDNRNNRSERYTPQPRNTYPQPVDNRTYSRPEYKLRQNERTEEKCKNPNYDCRDKTRPK
jgi:hypothetical protein